jgi:hypothetical protein
MNGRFVNANSWSPGTDPPIGGLAVHAEQSGEIEHKTALKKRYGNTSIAAISWEMFSGGDYTTAGPIGTDLLLNVPQFGDEIVSFGDTVSFTWLESCGNNACLFCSFFFPVWLVNNMSWRCALNLLKNIIDIHIRHLKSTVTIGSDDLSL